MVAVQVEGLSDLIAAFARADAELAKEIRGALKDAGEAVRVDAQGRAAREIRNIGTIWPQMRLGVSRNDIVYIAPKQRRKSGHTREWARPNLGPLLLREMDAAAKANMPLIEREVVNALENVHQNAGLTERLHNL